MNYIHTLIKNTIHNHTKMLVSELGQQIKDRRGTLGITQPDLAELADISVNTLYKIETGQANPTIKIINKIAEIIGMELQLIVKTDSLH
jgi:transcriptional regulator with XRE-family HTH domain